MASLENYEGGIKVGKSKAGHLMGQWPESETPGLDIARTGYSLGHHPPAQEAAQIGGPGAVRLPGSDASRKGGAHDNQQR